MALRLKNRVQETSTTTGTGTVTLNGAPPTGFQTFANALTDGDTTYYQITDGTDWEIGLGTFISATNELQRTEVFESSNNNAKVSFGAGAKDVFIVMPAEKVSGTTSYGATSDLPLTANQVGDQAFVTANNKLYIWSGSGWYAIATVNLTPTVSGNDVTYQLATDGTPTTVTLTGTDPEGFPLTWSATESGDTGIAATTNVDNVFTITPVTSGSSGTMIVTFSASDGTNTATASSTFTLAFVSALWPDVTLSIGTSSTNSLGNETFIDRSANAHTATPTGSPIQTAFHPYLDNWAVSLRSNAAYITIADDSTLNLTGEFTIEVWYKQYSYGTNNSRMFQRGANSTTGYCLLMRDDGTVKFGRTDEEIVGYNQNLSDGQWHHHAVTRDASNNVRIFFDGVLKDTATLSDSLTQSGALHIGAFPGGTSTNRIDGDFSNFRLVTGSALYTSNFTPSTTPLTDVSGTQVLTLQDNRFVDNSSNNLTVTPANGAAIIPSSPFGQGSEYTVGENKGSMTTNDDTNNFISFDRPAISESDDIALSFWVYITDDAYENWYTDTDATRFLLYGDANGTELELYVSSTTIITTSGLTKMEWHHVEVNRASGTWYLHVDGEYRDSTTTHGTTSFNASTQYIAYNSGNGTNTIKGYISDYYFSIGNALHTSISNFTPPTAPVGNTNANLYLPMDNAGVFDKTGNATLLVPTQAAGGAPLTDTSIKKFADSSINFGTTSDDKLWQVNGVPPLGSGPFTIEGWIYPTNVTGTWQSVITRDYGGTGGFRLYKTSGAAEFTWYRSSTSTLTTDESTTPLVNNTWHHFAVCRDASDDLRIFIDGVQSGPTVANDYDYLAADPDNPLNIGSGGLGDASAYPFSGNLENIQVLVGVAKYTSNFTAPTVEQGRNNQAED